MLKSLLNDFEDERYRLHLGIALLKTLDMFSDRINQVDEFTGESETFKSVLKRSIQIAIWLRKYGVKEGDVVVVSGANHLDACIPILASFYIGAVVIPVDPKLKNTDMKHTLQLSKPKLIFCDPDPSLFTVLESVLKELNLHADIVTFGDSGENYKKFHELLCSSEDEIKSFKAADLDPKLAPALIMCTSGTTGTPKGVVMSHRAVLGKLLSVWNVENEVILAVSSIHWFTGITIILASCLFGATRVQSSKVFTHETAFRIMKKYKPTFTLMNPYTTLAWLTSPDSTAENWSSIKKCMVLGGVVYSKFMADLKKCIPNAQIILSYGMTECIGTICDNYEPSPTNLAVGKLAPTFKAKIVDPDGNQLGPHKTGELVVKSDFIFTSYHNSEKETSEAFTADGWFRTGDLMYYDENNVYHFVERLKFIMIYYSNRMAPAEFEEVIIRHPSVARVVVDKLFVEPHDFPVALIVKKPQAVLSAQEIKDFLADKLAPYKQLHGGVIFVDEIPMTVTGKVDRRLVREIINNVKAE